MSVDESPTALMLVQRVLDQSDDNVGQAARGCQELLARYGSRLLRVSEDDPDRFTSVRARVEEILLSNPSLLERFRKLQSPLAEELYEAGDYREVVKIAALTPWGLKASLALAQVELESGEIDHVRRRLENLEGHSDLQGRAARHRLCMLGMAAHLDGDEALADEMVRRLRLEDDVDGLTGRLLHLRSIMEALPSQSIDTLDTHEVLPPTESGWHQVWADEHEDSLFSRIVRDRMNSGMSVAQRTAVDRISGTALVSCPLVTEDSILISDGMMLHSYDRYSASDGWSVPIFEGSQGRTAGGGVADLAELAVDGEFIYAISGFAYATARSGGGEIVCLDLETGAILWRTSLDGMKVAMDAAPDEGEGRLDQQLDLSDAFPYGGITVSGGSVVFAARKVNSRRETVTYLVGLDAEDGHLRWVRMVGSSGGVRTQRGFSRPIGHEDSVIISSPVGVTARLNAATGEVIWLRRFPVPLSVTNYAVPWEIAQPAVLDDHLYLVGPDGRNVLMLDVATGEELESWPCGVGTTWGDVRYLLADEWGPGGGSVYAVGSDIVAMSGSVPGMPRWRFSESAIDQIHSRVAFTNRSGNRGRVHVAGPCLLVPGAADLLILDAANGKVLEQIPTNGPSNPILLESQIVLGNLDGIVSLMQLGPAETLLRDRIAEAPDDPTRPLGLLELGLQSERPELALEAAMLMIELVEDEELPDIREPLIGMLLRLLEQTAIARQDIADQVVDLATMAARTDAQVAKVLLASGDLALLNDSPDAAVETWLRILSDPELSGVTVSHDDGLLSAELIVRRRIMESAPELRRRMETRLESLCRAELDALDVETATALAEIAGRYPGAPSALAAWQRAATLHESAGDSGAAVDALLAAVRTMPDDPDLRLKTIELQRRSGWNRDAKLMLQRIMENPDLRGPFVKLAARRKIDLPEVADEAPRIGLTPGDGFSRSGRLVDASALRPHGAGAMPMEGLLTVSSGRLDYRSVIDSKEPDWSFAIEDRAPRLIHESAEMLAIWSQPTNLDPTLIVLDRSSGRELWRMPGLETFLPELSQFVPGRRAREGMMPGGRIFSSREVVPVLAPGSLILVRRAGDLVALDFDLTASIGGVQSQAAKWRIDSTLDRVYNVFSTDRLLLLSGVERSINPQGEAVEIPKVVVVDIATGRRIRIIRPLSGDDIRWLAFDPSGRVLISTRSSLESHPLHPEEETVWLNDSPQAVSAIMGWPLGDRVVTLSEGGLVAFEMSDGSVVPGAFALSDSEQRNSQGLISLRQDSRGITALFDQRLVRFDLDGRVIGMDALAEVGSLAIQAGAQGLELVFEQLPRSIQDGFYRYRLHIFDQDDGLRLVSRPLDLKLSRSRLIDATVLDGLLLLSTSDSTVIIPMPENLNQDRPLTDG